MESSPKDPIVEVRRKRLRQWIDEHFEGLQTAFIASTNDGEKQINQGELSGLLKSKTFGEKRARALERQAHMPERYLDTIDQSPNSYNSTAKSATQVEPLTRVLRNPAMEWPFARVPRERLLSLKRDLGPRRGLDAIDDIDRTLEVMVIKWEQQVQARKSSAG